MKLFARYSRINLMMMVGIFLLSSLAFYWLVNLILVREMDADLAGVEARIRDYATQYNTFPQAFSLDEAQISYQMTDHQEQEEQFERVTLYSHREKKMHNFRQLVFYMHCGGASYKVTIPECRRAVCRCASPRRSQTFPTQGKPRPSRR